jgi:pimeloyl-ACP methyl ester carboxylesterase
MSGANQSFAAPLPRRRFAQTAASALAAASGLAAGGCATAARTGAWYGAWYWRKLTPLLQQAGCTVHTPTFTGLGERVHLATRQVGLDTHVQDTRAVLHARDLQDVVLVAHSYAGMVASQLLEDDGARARVRQIVYLDAFVPESGKSLLDYLFPLARRQAIAEHGSRTGFVPPIPAPALGVSDPADLAWIAPRVVPQPFGTMEQPVRLAGEAGAGLPRAYVHCVEPPSGSFGPFAQVLKQRADWTYRELRTGHNAMITAPQALAETLLALAGVPAA